MFWKTLRTFQDRVEYTRSADGSWRAEFRGAFDLVVQAPTLERCRFQALDALDEKIAEWLVDPREVFRGSSLNND
jgi:hypothetical protein